MANHSTSQAYEAYVSTLKAIVAAQSLDDCPKIIILAGKSEFLRNKAINAIGNAWKKFNVGDAQLLESIELDQLKFQNLWSQVSLFEPQTMYILRRAGQVRGLASWLAPIRSMDTMNAHLVIDCAEKISADMQKQIKRLGAHVLYGEEPTTLSDYLKIAKSFARRHSIQLNDEAARYLCDAVGMDLSKIENEIRTLSLQYAGAEIILSRENVARTVGKLREDDVFELFSRLRDRKTSSTHLMCESFLNRGESAIALTGIFSRYAREQIERGGLNRGVLGLKACALADQCLKSSRIDESIVLSSIIDAMAEN